MSSTVAADLFFTIHLSIYIDILVHIYRTINYIHISNVQRTYDGTFQWHFPFKTEEIAHKNFLQLSI